jgi:4a-hydroxytetrahydrobiopterin dehydratase
MSKFSIYNKNKTALEDSMAWINDDNMLIKDFEFEDFQGAISFVTKIADIAEKMNHHPNILIHDYKHVRVTLSTHSEGKVTSKDIELSRQIDGITA